MLLATELLQRARLADAQAGIWEAADVQWWWRKARRSDGLGQVFWIDEKGPVAGVLLTSWTDSPWQCDLIMVPGLSGVEPELVWGRALEEARVHAVDGFEVPVRDDDLTFKELVQAAGLVAGASDSTAWMSADDRRAVRSPALGFALIDRTQRGAMPHPMRHRNGDEVEERLIQCPLYDPELDLAIEAVDGRVAGYSLYWFDPMTKVGLVEPVRVEDEYQRRGLAKAMLTAGIDRLAKKGAQRIKVSYRTEPASALYQALGFRPTSTTTWFKGPQT
ncbi:MAG TPA: GNAT family N-acetyltransferase [Candidatus Dormibacteraeota bacterium]|nr:GNAT family N-acetyltransferase [Candidatus Dormibacteraeota bacterium]